MSGVCPVPTQVQKTAFAGTFSQATDPLFNTCAVSQTTDVGGGTVTVTMCCPTPGPPGPPGPASGLTIKKDGVVVLSNVTVLDFQRAARWILNGASSAVTIDCLFHNARGVWTAGQQYLAQDIVTDLAASFLCLTNHTSSTANKPEQARDYNGGGTEWLLLSEGEVPTTLLGTFGDLFDWIKDIANWNLKDWLQLLSAGLGLLWAGSTLLNMFNDNGTGDGNADSRFNGDLVYTGAFTNPTLPTVVGTVCEWGGLTSFDTSQLPATPVNFTIGDLASARSILEMLSLVYFFDMVDSGGILKFVPRASQTVVKNLISDNDLGWTKQGNELPPPIVAKRMQSIDLPRSVTLTYFSQAAAHNKMTQTATLETFVEGEDVAIDVPVTLTENKAVEVAEMALVNAFIERDSYGFITNWNHIDLEPGDVINIDTVGDCRIIRVDEEQENGLLSFLATNASFNTTSYVPSGIPDQPAPVYTNQPIQIGYSTALIIESPPIDETDKDKPRLTIAPHGYNKAGWPGCSIYVSIDGGLSYNLVGTSTQQATWGKVVSPTPAPPSNNHWLWDETTVIQVVLKTGSLSSVTKPEVYNGSNWAYIGQELIGFRSAVLVSGMTYNLSGLLRGRRGTEFYMGVHGADEQFILRNDALVEFPYDVTSKETLRKFKFVTFGSTIDKATPQDAQPDTKSLRPWAVADLLAVKQGNNDWIITYTERNQFDGELVDSHPVLHPEGWGGYIVQILDGATLKRSFNGVTQNTVTYTVAQQITDFGVAQNSIKVRCSQIDLRVGPGYSSTNTF